MVMIRNKKRGTDIYKRFGGDALTKIKQKIENEKTLNSKYMSGQLCKFIDKLPKYKRKLKSTHRGKFSLKTPFGTMTALKKSEDEVFIAGAGKYKNLVEKIKKQGENKKENIEEIYKYLSILSDNNIKNINQFNEKKVKIIKVNNALAGLCAILMIAEPYRFKDGGGLSRGYIRKAFSDISVDPNVLDKIFGSKGKEFKGKNESDAPFAHYDLGPKNRNRKLKREALGGKPQTKNLLDYDFNKNIDLENEKLESIKDNKERLSTADSYISDNEDEEEKKERIKKAYKKGEIHFFQAVGEIHELKNKSPKKSKIIGRKIFRSKPKDKNTNVNIKPIKKKKI